MATIDDVKRELNASIITLMRRRDSTADPAEKATIVDAIADLNGQLRMLNQAAVLQDAHSAADATTILERAVAAAKLGPFDGYLAALEAHLKNFSVLAGKTLAGESLERALMAPARARAVVGGKKAKQGKTAKGKKAKQSKKAARPAVEVAGLERADLESPGPVVHTSLAFADLTQEYQDMYDRCTVRPDAAGVLAFCVKLLKRGQPNYQLVERQIRVPWAFVGIIHGLECSFDFTKHLHNGDPLSARTVQVPRNRPASGKPPFTWLESALDALQLQKLDQVSDWSVPHMLYLLEAYNGFGYRKRALPTPYLWGSSNNYEKGKFVADGHFDPDAVSKQCGAALILKALR